MEGRELGYRERHFASQDGLAIYYRDYGERAGSRPALLCLAGLTRNSKDFHGFALRHASQRRVLAMDYRGRGRSDRDPDWRNYRFEVYARDVMDLLAATNAHRVIVVGTSLGGVLAMGLAAARPTALAAVVLNDIGPEIDPAGLRRIGTYVGKVEQLPDWERASAYTKELFGASHPDLSEEDWRTLTRNHFREGADGAPEMDYDPALGRAFEVANRRQQDLWPLFRALESVPTMVIRGALSDILGEATVQAMAAAKADLVCLTVPNRGHAPLLDEPACRDALDDFIARH